MDKIWKYISAFLLIIIMVMVYKFIIAGSTLKLSDNRQAILLEPSERIFVLDEMNAFIVAIAEINRGLSENNFDQIQKASAAVGEAARTSVEASVLKKLPLEFKAMGFQTHGGFEEISKMAASRASTSEIQGKLGDVMQNCVACHSGYILPQSAK